MRIVKNGSVVDEITNSRLRTTGTKRTILHVWGGNAPRKTYVHVRNTEKGYKDAHFFLVNLYGNVKMNVAASCSMKTSEIAYQF